MSILREPEHPMQLFTTDSLVLTCVIDLIPEVDSYVTVNSQWSGHSSLTDRERRVIVSDLEGVRLTYNTSVTFSTLKSSDSGTYTCSATVAPVRDRNLIESQTVDETISISVGKLIISSIHKTVKYYVNFSSKGYYSCDVQPSL